MATVAPPQVHSARCNPDGRIIDASPEMLGLHRQCGGGPDDAFAVPGLALLVCRAAKLGMPLSSTVLLARGSGNATFWVRAVPKDGAVDVQLFDWAGGEDPLVRTLQQSVRDRDFIRAASDWAWQADATLNWTRLSDAAVAAFARPLSFLVGQPMADVLRPLHGADDDLRNGADPALWFRGRCVATRGDSSRRFYRLDAVPVHNEGRLAGFSGTAVEISEAEALAVHDPVAAPKDEKGEAAGAAASDILRGPLDQITRSADAMHAQQFGHLKSVYADYAGDIASAARHLRTLIDDVFDVAAIDSGTVSLAVEQVDLTTLAEQARAIVSQRAAAVGSAILWRDPPPSAIVRGDRGRILQIVINLVQNAVKFAGSAGPVRLALQLADDEVLLRVDDAGQGIDPAHRERVFARFERLQPRETEGTGLGLYISRALARAMGGEILVSDAPEGGARFTLVLTRG